jgi:hypothetical protein
VCDLVLDVHFLLSEIFHFESSGECADDLLRRDKSIWNLF